MDIKKLSRWIHRFGMHDKHVLELFSERMEDGFRLMHFDVIDDGLYLRVEVCFSDEFCELVGSGLLYGLQYLGWDERWLCLFFH